MRSPTLLTLDGSQGEGGGQILRSALTLSLATGRPFHMHRIRAGRPNPGLQRQHLAAVHAAAEVGHADVRGATLGSLELAFTPGPVHAGDYRFDIGTAGSAALVLQTVLPPLLLAGDPSHLTITGGTHNTHAPPFDFIARTFAPLLNRMAVPAGQPRALRVELVRHGFYPAGGGEIHATIVPPAAWQFFELLSRGTLRGRRARVLVSRLPVEIAQRELRVVAEALDWAAHELIVEEVLAPGPGNVLLLELEFEHVTEIVTAFGARGVRAEQVAQSAVAEVRRYLTSDAPVGEHLADQLLLPLALAAGGTYRVAALTAHTTTNIAVLRRFLDVDLTVETDEAGAHRIHIARAPRRR